MITSKTGLMIRFDNKEVRVFESKFERNLGDILTIDGIKYKVCQLDSKKEYAMAFLGTFRWGWCSKFFDFNQIDGKSK